jgi:uncharacterized membrane protein YqjE
MGDADPKTAGVFASLRRMGDLFLALAQSRVQLFALELQSEKLRLVDALLRLGLGLVVGTVGLMLGVATLALYLWEVLRFGGLLVMTGILVGAGAVILWRLRERLRNGPTPFLDTLVELKKDHACLQKRD